MHLKLWTLATALIALAALGGCSKASDSTPDDSHHGRYVGVGLYAPGDPWTQMAAAQPAKGDTPAARNVDDQIIIVTADSVTGEVRACGDMTGYCIAMNPWSRPLPPAQRSPINLTQHARRGVNVNEQCAEPGQCPDAVAGPTVK